MRWAAFLFWPLRRESEPESAMARKARRRLTLAKLKQLPVGKLADYLFLWTTISFGEDAYQLVRAWGFEPVTKLYRIKTSAIDAPGNRFTPRYGIGFWFRG